MGGHGLPMPKGPMNADPYQWMKSLRGFTQYALKHDKGVSNSFSTFFVIVTLLKSMIYKSIENKYKIKVETCV